MHASVLREREMVRQVLKSRCMPMRRIDKAVQPHWAKYRTVEALSQHAQWRHIRVEDGPGRALGRSFRVKLWPTLGASHPNNRHFSGIERRLMALREGLFVNGHSCGAKPAA